MNRAAKRQLPWVAKLGLTLVGVGATIASPALASCPNNWTEETCYSAQYSVSYAFGGVPGNFNYVYGATPQATSSGPGLGGIAAASADSVHNGTLIVEAVTNQAGYHSSAAADLAYSFKVAPIGGAAPDALIPLRVVAGADIFRSGDTNISGKVLFDLQTGPNTRIRRAASEPFGRVVDMLRIDEWINVMPNAPILLFMEADTSVFATGGVDRLSSRVVFDPVFEIAPDFASQYQLIGLPSSVSPPSAAPEPASWVLMLGGLGLVGGAMRRQRRAGAARFA